MQVESVSEINNGRNDKYMQKYSNRYCTSCDISQLFTGGLFGRTGRVEVGATISVNSWNHFCIIQLETFATSGLGYLLKNNIDVSMDVQRTCTVY